MAVDLLRHRARSGSMFQNYWWATTTGILRDPVIRGLHHTAHRSRRPDDPDCLVTAWLGRRCLVRQVTTVGARHINRFARSAGVFLVRSDTWLATIMINMAASSTFAVKGQERGP